MSADLLTNNHDVGPRSSTYMVSKPFNKRKSGCHFYFPDKETDSKGYTVSEVTMRTCKVGIQTCSQATPLSPLCYVQSLNSLTKTKNELKQMVFHYLPLPPLTQSLHLLNLAQNYTKPKCQDALCNRHCQQDDSGDDASL